MAKTTKGGRAMNPTDAARKQARKKEIARNKMERDLQRATPKDVSEINKRLEELIEEEEHEKARGRQLSKSLHIRRKVLQDAMKLAVAKERVRCVQASDALCSSSSRSPARILPTAASHRVQTTIVKCSTREAQ
jgi:hypothetical protein